MWKSLKQWLFWDRAWFQWLWSLLPDHCSMVDCERYGVRGNENRIPTEGGGYRLMCDYCHSKQMRDFDDRR